MNQMLRRSEYEKISAVIGVVKKQLEQYNKEKFARKLKANAKVGRYHYIIELDNTNPHDYIVVPKDLSQFDEEEIIIFPYFYWECTNVEDFTSGAAYNIRQILPESD